MHTSNSRSLSSSSPQKIQIPPLASDAFQALTNAIVAGAFQERMITLRTLISHDDGNTRSPHARELASLQLAAHAIVSAMPAASAPDDGTPLPQLNSALTASPEDAQRIPEKHNAKELPSLLLVGDVAKLLCVSVGTVYNLRKRADRNFPLPAPIGLRGERFHRHEIEAWKIWGPDWAEKLGVATRASRS